MKLFVSPKTNSVDEIQSKCQPINRNCQTPDADIDKALKYWPCQRGKENTAQHNKENKGN